MRSAVLSASLVVCIALCLYCATTLGDLRNEVATMRTHHMGRIEGNRNGIMLLSQHMSQVEQLLDAVCRGDTVKVFLSPVDSVLLYGLIRAEEE